MAAGRSEGFARSLTAAIIQGLQGDDSSMSHRSSSQPQSADWLNGAHSKGGGFLDGLTDSNAWSTSDVSLGAKDCEPAGGRLQERRSYEQDAFREALR